MACSEYKDECAKGDQPSGMSDVVWEDTPLQIGNSWFWS